MESSKSVAEANAGKLVHKSKIRESQFQDEKYADCLYGKDILQMSAADESLYNIHFPFRRGSAFVNDKVIVLNSKFLNMSIA